MGCRGLHSAFIIVQSSSPFLIRRYTGRVRSVRFLIAATLILASSCVFAEKKKAVIPVTTLPRQVAEIQNFDPVIARKDCPSWRWAAGVETMLRDRGIRLPQTFWLDKGFGGELCADDLDLDKLATAIAGDYVLADGRHAHIDGIAAPGAPADNIDNLILHLREGHTVVVVWQGRPYMLRGLVYNEYVTALGSKRFDLLELRLVDPVATGKERSATFLRDKDDPNDIQGVFDVNVTFADDPDWLRKHDETDWLRRADSNPAAPQTDWLRRNDQPPPPPPADWQHKTIDQPSATTPK